MPSAETEALAVATREDGTIDHEVYRAEYERRLAERQDRLVREAQPLLRSIDGWRHIESPEDWDRTVRETDQGLQDGKFLIDRLGGARHIDPELMAALCILRRHLIDESGANTAAELLMIDATLLSYAHMLRINAWIGDLAVAAEEEFFGRASLTAKLDRRYGRNATVRGLRVEEIVQRLSEQLMPLLDRSNRMMLRNLKALKEHKRPTAPNLSIGQAGQVNVGSQQVNVSAGEQTSGRSS